jgi:hypothetical protein
MPTRTHGAERQSERHSPRPSGPRERVLLELRNELARSPVPLVHGLADDLEWLTALERERGGAWLENAISRTQHLVAVARLAELGRQKLWTAERHRARQRLQAHLDDERLVPEVSKLVADGEPVKVIQHKLGLSKERVTRIKRLAAAQAAYQARFPPRR